MVLNVICKFFNKYQTSQDSATTIRYVFCLSTTTIDP